MQVISNNLLGKMPIRQDAIIRINLAWIKNIKEAERLVAKSKHKIYLDYPTGRLKPPQPKISLTEALELSHHKKVKYFAVSNCEFVESVRELMESTPAIFVPKIETELGVKNMGKMAKLGIKHFMLDKEDLYTECKSENKKYLKLVKKARRYKGVMELQGVVFI